MKIENQAGTSKPDLSRVAPEKLSRLKDLILKSALHRSGQHVITDAVGNKLEWLMDLRSIFLDGEAVDLATDVFWDVFAEYESLQVAGLELGSVPFIGAVVQKGRARGKQVNGLVVRRSRKKEGLLKRIEGQLSSAPIVIVDDLMNSGSSLTKVVQALRDEQRQAEHAFVFIRYRTEAVAIESESKVPVQHLFTLSDFGLDLSANGHARPVKMFETAWSFVAPMGPPRFDFVIPKCNPVLHEQTLYFGADNRIFYAVDARTGKQIWSHDISKVGPEKGIWSTPVINDNRVFYGGYDGNFYCRNASTGAEVWTNTEADWIGSSPSLSEELGLVFIGMEFSKIAAHGSLRALSIANGETVWKYDVRELLHGSPVYSAKKNVVGIGTNESTFLMLDARTGRELWMHQCLAPVKWQAAFGDDDRLVAFASYDRYVYVLEVDTGRVVFKMKAEFAFACAPLIVGDFVVAGSLDKGIYIGHLVTGAIQRIETDGRIYATPSYVSGSLWIGNNAGALLQLECDTANKWNVVGRYQLPDRVLSKMASSEALGLHYVLTGDSRLFAFKEKI